MVLMFVKMREICLINIKEVNFQMHIWFEYLLESPCKSILKYTMYITTCSSLSTFYKFPSQHDLDIVDGTLNNILYILQATFE